MSATAVGSAPRECGGGELYRVAEGSGIVAPTLRERISLKPPSYTIPDPHGMGVVIVEAVVDAEGKVCAATLWRGTGTPFDQQVLEGIKHWRFTPATLNGKAINCLLMLTEPVPRLVA